MIMIDEEITAGRILSAVTARKHQQPDTNGTKVIASDTKNLVINSINMVK